MSDIPAAVFTFGPPSPGVDERSLRDAERELGFALPPKLVSLLRQSNGFQLLDGITLCSAAEMAERNSTLEVAEYLPGYVAFADDSGDQAFVLSLDIADPRVYQVDVGAMTATDLEPLASDLES